jgi:hypothetical protein
MDVLLTFYIQLLESLSLKVMILINSDSKGVHEFLSGQYSINFVYVSINLDFIGLLKKYSL